MNTRAVQRARNLIERANSLGVGIPSDYCIPMVDAVKLARDVIAMDEEYEKINKSLEEHEKWGCSVEPKSDRIQQLESQLAESNKNWAHWREESLELVEVREQLKAQFAERGVRIVTLKARLAHARELIERASTDEDFHKWQLEAKEFLEETP